MVASAALAASRSTALKSCLPSACASGGGAAMDLEITEPYGISTTYAVKDIYIYMVLYIEISKVKGVDAI